MASRLVALPVGQGDAFFYERGGLRALIDGGKSAKRIVGLVNEESIGYLNVLVCTHNDKDHAEGVAGLLESETIEIGEVWLPGRWSERLVDLCRTNMGFFSELAIEVGSSHDVDLEAASARDEDSAVNSAPERESRQHEEGADLAEGPPSKASEADEEEILDAIDGMADHVPWWDLLWEGFSLHGMIRDRWELWLECLTAAERIRRIARGARNIGARIRWFDFAEFSTNGLPGGGESELLVPVNAVEIAPRFIRRKVGAYDFLRLSVANRESLVFHAPATNEDADILFSADSDLEFELPNMTSCLATAPHHGSDANANAYSKVGECSESTTWVRSDGRFRKRPGKAFLERQANAYCTRCRGASHRGQTVRLQDGFSSAGLIVWQAASGVRSCGCK